MTAKRFTLFDDGETIIDNESVVDDGGKEIYWIVEYVQVVKLVELLNELHEENQLIKDTLNELKSIDGFWDSALLQGHISKIAKILGVDLE